MFDTARDLRDLYGWSIIKIPRGEKRARVSWKRYQSEHADDATLRRWFHSGDSNLAVITGSVSGGLVVRDFDEAGAYPRWAAQRPELAARCPTVQTARGYHVYCQMADVPRVIHVPDGELRGDGGYCLLPPSVHPTGSVYRWSIALGELPALTATDFDLAPPLTDVTEGATFDACYRSQQKTTHSQQRANPQSTESHRHDKGVHISDGERQAVLASLPTAPGQREKRLWLLARRLLAIHGPHATYPTLRPAFDLWWSHARPVVGTQTVEDSLAAFLRSYQRANTPLEDVLGQCLAMAQDNPIPEWSHGFSPPCTLLAGLCRELQRWADGEPFFISARTAGAAVGVSHVHAARWLSMFNAMGVLQLIERGTQGGGLASRYRYLADDLRECLP